MASINELRDQRAKLATDMRSMVELVAKENRAFTGDENEKFDKLNIDQESLRSNIKRVEQTDAIEAELKEVRSIGAGRETKEVVTSLTTTAERQMGAWRNWIKFGPGDMAPAELSELRALGSNAAGSSTPTAGGYLAPSQPTSEFIKMLRDLSGIRGAPVRILQTSSGNTIPFPTTDDTSNTAEQVDENPASAIEDTTDPTFGQVNVQAFAFDSTVVRISKQLLQDSVVPVESLINEQLAERIAAKINTAYTTGTGSGQPQGIVIGAGNSNITFPVSTFGADGGVVYANLQSVIHSIAPQYRKRPSFGLMFNDATLLKFKQLVDSQNRPLWSPSFAASEPDRIAGIPYWTNPDMATVAASAKTVIVGDFSQFIVRDVMSVEFIRLDELYARYLQVGFLVWFRTDSRVMNSSAIKYAKHASS